MLRRFCVQKDALRTNLFWIYGTYPGYEDEGQLPESKTHARTHVMSGESGMFGYVRMQVRGKRRVFAKGRERDPLLVRCW